MATGRFRAKKYRGPCREIYGHFTQCSVSWISDFLTKTTVSVRTRVGSPLSPQQTISTGVPKLGSHLGPVQFLVFIKRHVHLPTELYADDTPIHDTLKRNTTVTNTTALQGAVNDAEQMHMGFELEREVWARKN